MKFPQLAIALFVWLASPAVAIAEPLCYITTNSGNTVDLTDSLCSKEKKKQQQLPIIQSNKKQQELLEAKKHQANKRQQLQKKHGQGQ